MPLYNHLTLGLNLFGLTTGANMKPGEATDACNWIPRPDGSLMKHWGARRISNIGFDDPVQNHIGFTYKGKNNDAGVNPDRPGNFGLLDDDAIFTRRDAFYPGALVLTDTEAWIWDHVTRDFIGPLALPGGVTVDPDPRPTMLILQNNVYICGWATSNLRYDPTDQALYEGGWDSLPTLGAPSLAGGGTLRPDVTYKYRAAWVDLYTGEQSGLGPEVSIATTSASRTVNFLAGDFPVYAGTRKFVGGGGSTDHDVGIALYRTEGDEETFHFLDLVRPDLATATLTDDGLFTDTARPASTVPYEDPKRYAGMVEYRNMVYGISWEEGEGATRVYFNDFTTTKSHFERTRPLNFRELPLTDGEVLTAIGKTHRELVCFSNKDAYAMQVFSNQQTGQVQQTLNPMEWTVGCVGPLAWEYVDGWLYFLSDRGPYRWRSGMAEPEWISKDLLPLFIDPQSGLCKLNVQSMAVSEVFYDRDADVVRYVFPTGNSKFPNEHIYQWARPELNGGDATKGWFFGTPEVHSFSQHSAFGIISPDTGEPESQFDRKPLVGFADNQGYVLQYDPNLTAFGLPEGTQGCFEVNGGSVAFIDIGGLPDFYTNGDGLAGLRFELVRQDGTIDVGFVDSNTSTRLFVVDQLASAPTSGDTLYVGGFPCFWRSWIDHGGSPTSTKKTVHFWVGMNATGTGDSTLDVVMTAGDDVPITPKRTRNVKINANQQKMLSSLTGRWFFWEFANSRPNEPVHVNFIKTDLEGFPQERR